MPYAHHTEARVDVSATPAEVFAFLDDQEALGAHMTQSSAMMAGGRMSYDFDEGKGRVVGSVIRMRGEMMGITLKVEEVVTERDPPNRKVLETRGDQAMLVIDAYRLGYEIQPRGAESALRVFIDYNLPAGIGGVFARLPAHVYARWCITQMANTAAKRFSSN